MTPFAVNLQQSLHCGKNDCSCSIALACVRCGTRQTFSQIGCLQVWQRARRLSWRCGCFAFWASIAFHSKKPVHLHDAPALAVGIAERSADWRPLAWPTYARPQSRCTGRMSPQRSGSSETWPVGWPRLAFLTWRALPARPIIVHVTIARVDPDGTHPSRWTHAIQLPSLVGQLQTASGTGSSWSALTIRLNFFGEEILSGVRGTVCLNRHGRHGFGTEP